MAKKLGSSTDPAGSHPVLRPASEGPDRTTPPRGSPLSAAQAAMAPEGVTERSWHLPWFNIPTDREVVARGP